MKSIFFDWHDFEASIVQKYTLTLPDTIVYVENSFSLEAAKGYEVLSIFVSSYISDADLTVLAQNNCKKILLRSAGYNMVNVALAKQLGIQVLRVASYSPESIAEFVFALALSLARKLNLQREHQQRQSRNLTDKLMGFLLRGKTIGIHGYGKIGQEVARIAREGFKMNVQYFDPYFSGITPDKQVASLSELYASSDIISIHVPLNNETRNSVNRTVLQSVKDPFMLINTSRGGIVNVADIESLVQDGTIDYLGVDVWGEKDDFDPSLLRDNVAQTEHVAFFTEESVKSIIDQTIENLSGKPRAENVL